MKVRNRLLNAAVGLGLLLAQGSPVFAQASSAAPTGSVEQSSVLQIPVVFKENYTQSGLDLTESSVDKYTEGTLIGCGINGDLKILVNGQTVNVRPKSVAISDEDKDRLKQEQEKEAEKRNRREDAQAKVDAEKTPDSSEDAVDINEIGDEDLEVAVGSTYQWNGPVLSRASGVNQGPSGKETYYNLPMQGVVSIMRSMGNTDEYWVREDGVKMLGNYVMVAAHLPTRPRGSLVPTSLGMGIVCDTGTFALSDHTQLDIAVAW